MTPLFIIPARGGSKGIPRKNIKALGGRPLIAYSIDIAKSLACDDAHIILSTDSKEIADVACEYGLKMEYKRPDELATDTSGSREVILDAMAWADSRNITYDCIVLLQPTSPFRTVEDIKNCLNRYSSGIDMVVSVKETSANPYYNCFEPDATTGFLHISKGSGNFTRRQDAPKCYEYNGAVYVINPNSLKKESMGKFARIVAVEMPDERSLDLDTPFDWLVAEAMIERQRTTPLPDNQND